MYEYHEFHESYYHHTCLIIPEKDVLDTDILGSGCVARFKRWWNDLFLLSYTCERSSRFYTSSHAMTIERFKQYRIYKHRIHPMSKFRIFWDCLILTVMFTNKAIFRFTSNFVFDRLPIHLFYLGAFFELIIIADIFINLMTGYIDTDAKRVVLDTKKSLLRFCSHKLFIHIASAIPLHWFMFLRYGMDINCGLCKTNRFICALKIVSMFSLYRVFETSAVVLQNRRSSNKQCYKFIRIAITGFSSMFQFFDISDAVGLLVIIGNGKVSETSLMGIKLVKLYGTPSVYLYNYKLVYFEISRGFKALLLFSFGFKGKTYYIDKLVSLVSYLIANAFYGWSLLECYALVCRMMYPKDQIMKIRASSYNMMACRQLPDELRSKLEQYFKCKQTKLQVVEVSNQLYRNLPKVLKTEAKLNCYMSLMRGIPFFSDMPLPILKEIVMMLKKQVYLNNDIVAEAWVPGEGLMIVDDGVLAVYSHFHKETGHLIDGDYFGELSLVTDNEICMSYVVAITPCTILKLNKLTFRLFMRNYPNDFYGMKTQMKERFDNPVASRRTSAEEETN